MNFKLLFLLLLHSLLFASPGYFEPWGKDKELNDPWVEKKEEVGALTKIADAIILFHQKVISPVDGPRSSYRPSSSQYMRLAMHRYGFFRGFVMGCDRLLRENDEEWVYRKIEVNGKLMKYDPATVDKYTR